MAADIVLRGVLFCMPASPSSCIRISGLFLLPLLFFLFGFLLSVLSYTQSLCLLFYAVLTVHFPFPVNSQRRSCFIGHRFS